MEHTVSPALKRCNYLFSETDMVYHEIYRALGLPDSAAGILYSALENGGGCLLRDICRHTGMSRQTVNSALRRLEKEGVLYLEKADGKNKMVRLTEEGRALAQRTAGRVLTAEDEIFAAWPPEDVRRYLELTEAYLLALKKKAAALKSR